MAQKYPIGLQAFSEVINTGCVYVDKTEQVYRLANSGKYFFLSRPRRFGKSLLLSTLDAYFSARRELFAGLAMERLETEWKEYPVLRLDLNNGNYAGNVEELTCILEGFLENQQRRFGIALRGAKLGERFGNLIQDICDTTGNQVVILVDEYDKPLVDNIKRDQKAVQEQMRDTLRSFYGNIKTMDQYIRFAMFTGVSRFSHVSIFSGLNNLIDISLDDDFSDICGICEDELHRCFDEGVAALAERYKMTKDEAYAEMKTRYDGFRFSSEGKQMYNPWSVMSTLRKREFGNYWFETATPSFLIKLIRDRQLDLSSFDGKIEATASDMLTYEDDGNYVALLYQTGYLTIKDYDLRTDTYMLGFPNLEVKQAFSKHLLPVYSRVALIEATQLSLRIFRSAQAGDVDTLLATVKGILAETAAETGNERAIELNYRNLISTAFRMSGLKTHIEVPTGGGRIDVALEADEYVYIFEFKRTSLSAAVDQIEDRHYADRYLNDPRRLIKVAVALDDSVRNIAGWTVI